MASVQLLGKELPITAAPGAEGLIDEVQPVIEKAVAALNAQFTSGQLNETQTNYIGALRGLGVAPHRGFTPCQGTADVADGEYVYFFGADDVAVNNDELWYASTIIHDGGHAWLSQNGQTAVGVDVEIALTNVQIDYYKTLGSRPTYITDLEDYASSPDKIQARIAQEV